MKVASPVSMTLRDPTNLCNDPWVCKSVISINTEWPLLPSTDDKHSGGTIPPRLYSFSRPKNDAHGEIHRECTSGRVHPSFHFAYLHWVFLHRWGQVSLSYTDYRVLNTITTICLLSPFKAWLVHAYHVMFIHAGNEKKPLTLLLCSKHSTTMFFMF